MIREIAEFCFNCCQHIFYNKFVFWGISPEEYLNKRNEILSKINDKDSKIDCTMRDNLLVSVHCKKDKTDDKMTKEFLLHKDKEGK